MAGLCLGTFLNKRESTGEKSLESVFVMPLLSAISIIPDQKQITPIIDIISSTAESAPFITEADNDSMLPQKIADTKAISIMKAHIKFSNKNTFKHL